MVSADVKARHRWRGALRVARWNAALLAAGLALIAAAGEAYLRATRPFAGRYTPQRFVQGVGLLRRPSAEMRHTDHSDFWTVSRTNRLGFADREPVSPARAAAGCHVAAIGDSFVEALEVPITDKFHVRLEALARRELPHLNVTTSAFGHGGYAPVNELAFYDQYARRLHPRLLVLVFTLNDLWGNSSLLRAVESGWSANRLPFVSARRAADGTVTLLAPDGVDPLLVGRLRGRFDALFGWRHSPYLSNWLRHNILRRWPHARTAVTAALRGRQADTSPHTPPRSEWHAIVRAPSLPPVFEEALELAGFALDQFVERTRRDGAALVILATYALGGRDDRAFRRLHALAAARGIPVINQHDYIVGRGAGIRDARWPRDGHWSPAGHQWAAEALLEHLRRHPEICRPRGQTARGSSMPMDAPP